MTWGKLCGDITFLVKYGHFLKLNKFYSNNATNLHHLTSQYVVLLHNMGDRIVTTDYCEATSPYVGLYLRKPNAGASSHKFPTYSPGGATMTVVVYNGIN